MGILMINKIYINIFVLIHSHTHEYVNIRTNKPLPLTTTRGVTNRWTWCLIMRPPLTSQRRETERTTASLHWYKPRLRREVNTVLVTRWIEKTDRSKYKREKQCVGVTSDLSLKAGSPLA